jgi:hypothetical protein
VAFFNDRLLEITDWSTGLDGDLDLSFQLDLVTSQRFDGFSVEFMAGLTPVPLPPAVWVLASALAALGTRARWRKG